MHTQQLSKRIFQLVRSASIALIACGATPALATPITNLVISEVMYEPAGPDNGSEWIEIYNGNATAVDLSDYSLSWGRNGLTDNVALASVILAPGATFVIGGPISDGDNGSPVYDQIYNFAPDLYDGGHGWQEDAVALFYDPTATLMHIAVYGGNGFVTAFVDEQGGTPIAVDVSGVGQGGSLEFMGSDTWQAQGAPSPGTPFASTIPEPSTAVLLFVGLLGLGRVSERRRHSRSRD